MPAAAVAAVVTAAAALADWGVAAGERLLPAWGVALACALAATAWGPVLPAYAGGNPRPPARGVFHAALGAALWALLAREVAAPACAWPQGFLLFMNAACLAASAAFHRHIDGANHDGLHCVDCAMAGWPMVAMLFVFRRARFDVTLSGAFLAALAYASYREILLRRRGDLRTVLVVGYFAYVEYATLVAAPPRWFAAQFVAFAACFANIVYVDEVRKAARGLPSWAPWHGRAWTAHEDAHVLLGLAQCLVYHRSVAMHALPSGF